MRQTNWVDEHPNTRKNILMIEEIEMKKHIKSGFSGEMHYARGCKCAYHTDEFHGWGCKITGSACVFLYPDSKACAERYGEGPDADLYGGSAGGNS